MSKELLVSGDTGMEFRRGCLLMGCGPRKGGGV